MRILIVFLLCLPGILPAQKQNNIWYFGEYAGLDFSSGQPVVLTDGAMKQLEGCASVCNSDGKLLFYTNGVEVWDATNHVMPNGKDLSGNYSTAQLVVVPRPQLPGRYYIFHADAEHGPKGLRYSEVDMHLNGGLGDVPDFSKNILLHQHASERIAAVTHQTDTSVWLISTSLVSHKFYVYLITKDGIAAPVKSPIIIDNGRCCNSITPSPDGNWLVSINTSTGGSGEDAELYTFDNQTGIVSFHSTIPRDTATREAFYGACFSPDNSKLYMATFGNIDFAIGAFNILYQYDFNAQNIVASQKVIHKLYSPGSGVVFNPWGALQIARNGKIYMARWRLDTLGVIHHPNRLGGACKFDLSGLSLNGKKSLLGLPAFNLPAFKPIEHPDTASAIFEIAEECRAQTYSFVNTGHGESFQWNFGDGLTSSESNPKHIFDRPGMYTVTLVANCSNCVSDTVSKIIEVKEKIFDSIWEKNCTCPIYIANTFSPNRDFINDSWKPILCDTRSYDLSIYNRWGELIFHSDKHNVPWDGTFKGSTVAPGIYLYKIKAQTQYEENIYRSGTLTLMR